MSFHSARVLLFLDFPSRIAALCVASRHLASGPPQQHAAVKQRTASRVTTPPQRSVSFPSPVTPSLVAMALGRPRSALQVGLAAVFTALVSLALVAESSSPYDTSIRFQGKAANDSARFILYDNPCKNVVWQYNTLTPVTVSIQWGNVYAPQVNRKCIGIAFHPLADCTGDSYVSYERPLPITVNSFTNW
ncbi:unnamed protein product [Closterium sp. NIES-54]